VIFFLSQRVLAPVLLCLSRSFFKLSIFSAVGHHAAPPEPKAGPLLTRMYLATQHGATATLASRPTSLHSRKHPHINISDSERPVAPEMLSSNKPPSAALQRPAARNRCHRLRRSHRCKNYAQFRDSGSTVRESVAASQSRRGVNLMPDWQPMSFVYRCCTRVARESTGDAGGVDGESSV